MIRGNATKVLTTIFATAEKIGATMPEAVMREHAKVAKLATTVDALDLRPDLAGVAVAAIAAGRDPLTDPAVQKEATRQALAGVQQGLGEAVAARAQTIASDHAGDIMAAFAPVFDKAAAALAAARERFGDMSLEDTQAILSRGGDAAQRWADAKAAESTVNQIRQAWRLLSTVAPVSEQPRYSLLVFADVPPAVWLDDRLSGSDLGPWDAVRAGYTLSLATPTTFRERVAAVVTEQERRTVNATEANRSAAFGKRAVVV